MERVLNLKKGDKCCVAIIKGSNASRYKDMSLENIDNWTYEAEVTIINKKYITVKFGVNEEKFVIEDDYRNKYSCGGADWQLFNSKEEVIYNKPERGEIIPVNDNDAIGFKRKLMTGCGSLHCTAFFDVNTGELVETYLSKGSTGGCNNFMVGLSRMISMASRAGVSIQDIVDQLMSTGSCPSYASRSATKHDTSKGSCCPMAVANALLEMRDEMQGKSVTKSEVTNPCPQCGAELEFQGGCNVCKSCGWTKCD